MYAVCLNFKHIYLYSAPAFGLFYVRQLVIKPGLSKGLVNLASLAAITLLIFALSFGPVLLSGSMSDGVGIAESAQAQMKQILSRLFPFKRGIVHSFMAGNFWCLYVASLKVLRALGLKSDSKIHQYLPFVDENKIDESSGEDNGLKEASLGLTVLFLIVSRANIAFSQCCIATRNCNDKESECTKLLQASRID